MSLCVLFLQLKFSFTNDGVPGEPVGVSCPGSGVVTAASVVGLCGSPAVLAIGPSSVGVGVRVDGRTVVDKSIGTCRTGGIIAPVGVFPHQ